MKHNMAIIGLGIMGRRMLENALIHTDFNITGLWDPSDSSNQKALQIMPNAPIAANATNAMEGADIVYLACPPGPRKAFALQASHAGKGVFMEKPLGTDNDESLDLVNSLKNSRHPGVVNFTQASSRGFDVLKKSINDGALGGLLGIDIVVNYSAWPRGWQKEADWLRLREEGGYTREVISHFLFLASRFLGPLVLTHSYISYPINTVLCELDLLARLENIGGLPVSILGTTGGQQPDRQEVTVKGTKVSYQFREFYQLWKSDGGPWVEALTWNDGEDPRRSSIQRQLTEVDKWLRGLPHKLATTEEAFSVQKLVEAILVGKTT